MTPLTPDELIVAQALVGDGFPVERELSEADADPDEWCAECVGRWPAAINAARIAVAALRAADRLPDGGPS